VVYSVDQFRDWLFMAGQGEVCLYHVGHMLVDQVGRPALKLLGDYAMLMSDFSAVRITHRRADDGVFQYFAARSSTRMAQVPQGVGTGQVPVQTYRALEAILRKGPRLSIRRTIRERLAMSEEDSDRLVSRLIKDGLLVDASPPELSDHGRRAMM
jgi:hypothetical protein